MFMDHLVSMVNYWDKVDERDSKEKLSGLAFSFLSMLDGCSMGLPAFEILPAPHPSDMGYAKDNDENWWPQLPEDIIEESVTIHGNNMLHDLWHKYMSGELPKR